MDLNGNPLRKLLVKLQRFSRAPGKRKFLYITLGIVAYLFVSSAVWKYHSEKSYTSKLSLIRKRLLRYCNPPGPPLGNEHNEPMEYAQFTLKQVQVVTRHGDRSSIVENFPNMMHFNCELRSPNLQHDQKLQMLKKMSKFLRIVEVKEQEKVDSDFLLNERKICKTGQLTGRGYLQFIYLGEYMQNMYGRRLHLDLASVEEEQIIVFATPFERTQQSAAAFLVGMLDRMFKNIPANISDLSPTVKIQVSSDVLGYFREDENNEIPSCPELKRLIKKEQRHSSSLGPLSNKISERFNLAAQKLPTMTQLFDIVATHQCHHHPPPCGPGGCIDDAVKLDLLKAIDEFITTKYTATATLAAHPLLSKIAQQMLTHITNGGYTRLVLFAAHDSTVAPLLIDLGIFQNQWPSYASRIVFELWEAGGLLGSKLAGENMDKYFIRVLYDGRDFTKKLKFCNGKLKFGKLCPLKAFIKALEGHSESMDVEYSRLCAG
ncbi:2-phosphoxylose phosphatase 1-like [Dendronephthya gigantea]|uniref:2-phosphoxylose phosphatase 1-like n=1 Tax=Dendronephthya gigantea TaxID=151771 RepID=UPI00106A2E9F|nr:2-phosphoxylose phosphatase 1-like [Dendronephthya gigantea]